MGFKPRSPAARFARSDGWLLVAMAHAETDGCARWRDIIASADYLERAIPTYEELAAAAERLDAAGLVRYRRTGVEISPATRACINTSTMDLRRRFAGVRELVVVVPEQVASEFPLRLERGDYDEAIRVHTSWG